MAAKGKTPSQIRDAKLEKLAEALKAKQITAAEYRKGVTDARRAFAVSSRSGGGAKAAVSIASKGAKVEQGFDALKTARKLKGPLEAVGRGVKRVGGVRGQLALAALSVAAPRVLKLGEDMRKQNEGKRVPTSSITKAEKTLGQRISKKAAAPKPVKASKRADSGDSARTPKPLTKAQQRGSMGLTGASYTVKKGDSLWQIAQDNKTTVSALLKANPELAKRKAAGKTTIYSGSKVRIPGKK